MQLLRVDDGSQLVLKVGQRFWLTLWDGFSWRPVSLKREGGRWHAIFFGPFGAAWRDA